MANIIKHLRIQTFIAAAIVALLLPICGAPATAYGAATTYVQRVGFFPQPGFHEYDEFGNPCGYDVEYLEKIAELTGWTYDYVKADSWQSAMKMLENHEIDILAPAQMTPERQEKFLFSASPIGREYGSILTLDTNNYLGYEDFGAFNNIRIGCVGTHVFRSDFSTYAREKSFFPRMRYYEDSTALLAALNAGEVDAIVANLMKATKNMKVLAKFAPSPFYYMVPKSRPTLAAELDDAISEIQLADPEFETRLVEKYYPVYKNTPFTKDELQYVEDAGTLAVGCPTDIDPVSYLDDNGNVAGITHDILERVSEFSGLKFAYVPLPGGAVTHETLLECGLPLVACVNNVTINARLPGIRLTDSYLVSEKVIISRENGSYSPETPLRAVVVDDAQTIVDLIKSDYPNFTVKNLDTAQQCLEALRKGEADVTIQNQYVIDRYLARPQYDTLSIVPKESLPEQLCIAQVRRDGDEELDPRLISVINKSLARIDRAEVSRIIIDHTANRPYSFRISDFIYQYRNFFAILAVALTLIAAAGIYILRLRRKNIDIIKNSEHVLKNITNNINGGVVVLHPDKGFSISYANEGFLEIIGYSRRNYEKLLASDYVTYVHPDDIALFNELADAGEKEKLSLRLRICRSDGTYVPTLFSGTLTSDPNGELLLYCVIMDLSAQNKIMEKLKLEQEKYELLMERSDEIIFTYDISSSELSMSPRFEKKFGWKLPKSFDRHDSAAVWRIYPNDMERFNATLHDISEGAEDSEFQGRVIAADGSAIWCLITLHILKSTIIVGKLTDIDAEMREKQLLVEKSKRDMLTGLYNKEAFRIEAGKYVADNSQAQNAVLFMDLDNFKQVNDVLGHMVGDAAIKDAAHKLQILFSNIDVISRFGGDEFCILIKDIPIATLHDKLSWAIEKLRATYTGDDGKSVKVSASIGVACSPDDGASIDELLQHADAALYFAKKNGKNCYHLASHNESKA